MLKGLFNKLTAKSHQEHQAELYRRFLSREAKIGGELFGVVPKDINREFFCLDQGMWVWHEERTNEDGELVRRTTRYDVRNEGIFKEQDGNSQPISIAEAKRLYDAALIYYQRIKREIYKYTS